MDDLTEKLNALLSSPDSMQKIQSMMAALSGDSSGNVLPSDNKPAASDAPATQPSKPSSADISGLLAALGAAAPAKEAASSAADSGVNLNALAKLAPVLSTMNKEDENTALLKALRPYLHGDREKRLDDALEILKLLRLLPLLGGEEQEKEGDKRDG